MGGSSLGSPFYLSVVSQKWAFPTALSDGLYRGITMPGFLNGGKWISYPQHGEEGLVALAGPLLRSARAWRPQLPALFVALRAVRQCSGHATVILKAARMP